MNLDEIKSVTLPEGNVTKIETNGSALWEKKPEIVFDPKASFTFYADVENEKIMFNLILSGLSKTLYKGGGLVYITKSKLNSLGLTNDKLNVNVTGRKRCSVTSLAWSDEYNASRKYSVYVKGDMHTSGISPTTKYVYRSFFYYTHPETAKTTYVYSDPVELIYNDLLGAES